MKTLNSLSSGTLHSSQMYRYRTRDGKATFTFSYEYKYKMGYYDIVIHDHPSYNDRDDDSCVAHWLDCDLSPIDRKVCFTEGKEPKTLEKAKQYSIDFAELTWTYILTGVTIDNQIISRN